MTQPVQLLNQTIHLHPNTSHFAHYTISAIEGVAPPALPFSMASCFCPPSSPSHIPLIPPFPPSLLYPPPPPKDCGLPTGEALFPGSLAGPLYISSCLAFQAYVTVNRRSHIEAQHSQHSTNRLPEREHHSPSFAKVQIRFILDHTFLRTEHCPPAVHCYCCPARVARWGIRTRTYDASLYPSCSLPATSMILTKC